MAAVRRFAGGGGSVCVEADPTFEFFAGEEFFAGYQIVAPGSTL
jgi:hypothetical protein